MIIRRSTAHSPTLTDGGIQGARREGHPGDRHPRRLPARPTRLRAALGTLSCGLALLSAPHEGPAAEPPLVLTNIATIKALAPETARLRLPLHLRGVITASTPARRDGFLQNESGAIYLAASDLVKRLKVGDLVEVDGQTVPGGFAPVVLPGHITVIGRLELPAATPATHASLADGRFDGERVSVEGRVVGILASDDGTRLNLRLTDGLATALLPDRPLSDLPPRLRGATVRLTGIAATGHNAQRQATAARMLVPGEEVITVLQPGPAAPDEIPRSPIAELLRYRPHQAQPDYVRIQGTVTAVPSSEMFFLEDESGGIPVSLGQVESTTVRARGLGQARVKPGDRVEAIGGPLVERLSVIFRADELHPMGQAALPPPAGLTAETIASGVCNWRRVTFTGRVAAQANSTLSRRLELSLKSGDTAVEADVPLEGSKAPAPVVGSLVRVEGVLDNRSRAEWNTEVSVIHLASAAGLQILAGPPANAGRLLLVAGTGVGATGALGIAWAFVLRRQVRARTRALSEANGRIARSEDLLRIYLDQAADALLVINETGRFLEANRRACESLGYSKTELLRLGVTDIDPGLNLPARQIVWRAQAIGASRVLEGCHRRKDGYIFPVEVHSRCIEVRGERQFLVLVRDITERKRAEGALRQSEERFRALVEQAGDAIVAHDLEGRFKVVNRRACDSLGYTREELLQMGVTDVERDFDLGAAQALWAQIRPGEPVTVRGHHRRKDGSVFPVEVRFGCFDLHGERQYLGLVRDLSEHEQMRAELRQAAQLQRAMLDNIPDPAWMKDLDGLFLAVNNAWCHLVGLSPPEVLGRRDVDLPLPDLGSQFHQEDRRLAVAGGSLRTEHDVADPLGRHHTFETFRAPVADDAGRVYAIVGIARDITERRLLEAQFRQAQKLEAIGQLAGGVAHDFNNILAAIMLQVGPLRLDRRVDPEVRESLAEVERTAARGATLTRQMLLFSRRSAPHLRLLDVNELIGDLLKMLHRLIGENTRLEFNPEPSLPPIEADAGMVEQVVTNLVVNARDAMPQGGTITILANAITLGEPDCRTHPSRRPGRFVRLTVADPGCGMDGKTLKHIFEPFFTTKEVGKGTGLGLATVHGIVAQHQGWVEAESAVGVGTTFRVYLPASDKTSPPSDPRTESPALPHGAETILLVEDEPGVRRALGTALRRLGYRVQETASPEEALKVWPGVSKLVDLLLTDMVMPGRLTGRQLAEQLRALRPGLKVIISSGYSAEIPSLSRKPEPGLAYLAKPYDMQTLSRLLRQCLETAAPAAPPGSTAPAAPEGPADSLPLRGSAPKA